MSILLLAGGTGLIGTRFLQSHSSRFDEIRILSRNPGPHPMGKTYGWDPEHGSYDREAFHGVDAVINLAGAGIADRPWTKAYRGRILQSRLDSIATLRDALQTTGVRPSIILSISGTGFYGDRGDEWVDESSDPGSTESFLTATTIAWEAAARELAADGHPLALVRLGILLSRKGGALPKLLMPLRFRISGYFGDGQQYVPWIHEADALALMAWILEGRHAGLWNAVAPYPVASREMGFALARAAGGHVTLPVPAWGLKILLGAMSETVLTGARVRANKVLEAGFAFRYPYLAPALEDLMKTA